MIIILLLASLLITIPASSQFKFAHITDTHVGNSTGADDLRRTVADLNTLNDLSFAIITGDITESGKDDDFRTAKQILDSLEIPWYIIPGNHDMKWSESGGTSFPKIFGSERFVFDMQEYSFIGLHQGPRMRMGDAYWTADDIHWLDSLLNVFQKNNRKVIIATHYPADSGIANWYEVTALARKYHVLAFLNGHWHQNRIEVVEGIASIIGRSNLRGNNESGGYNIGEIRNDSIFYSTRLTGIETVQLWTIVPLNNPTVPAFDSFHDTLQENLQKKYPDVRIIDKVTGPSSLNSVPAISPQYIAYAYENGKVVIQSRTKKIQYHLTTASPILSTPAISGSTIVISSTDSSISCYDFINNRLEWRYPTNKAIVAPPVIENNIVYCGASDHSFRAIHIKTGKLLWSFDSLQGHIESLPLIVHDKIIVGAWDEYLYCLNKRTGTLIWKWKGTKRGTLYSPAVCEPVTAYNKIFIVAPDRFMTAIDISTGQTIWRTNQFKVRETIGISEDKERVYIRTMNDSLYAIASTGTEPRIIWGTNVGFGYDINSSQIREKDGVVFMTTKNGLLIAADAKKGNVLWKFKEGNVIAHTPIPLSKDTVIFSNIIGTVCTIIHRTR